MPPHAAASVLDMKSAGRADVQPPLDGTTTTQLVPGSASIAAVCARRLLQRRWVCVGKVECIRVTYKSSEVYRAPAMSEGDCGCGARASGTRQFSGSLPPASGT